MRLIISVEEKYEGEVCRIDREVDIFEFHERRDSLIYAALAAIEQLNKELRIKALDELTKRDQELKLY